MELSKSAYYYRPHMTPEEQQFEEELTKRIEEIATELTITLLRERRTALIAAAVTGKIVLLKK